jgi:general secretion pathway protein G
MRKVKNAGFSLIELIVVITIMVLLTTIGVVSFTQANASARDGKRKADLEQVRSALVLYRTDQGTYPNSINWDTMSPIQSYISVSSMADPKGQAYEYTSDGTTFSVCTTLEKTTPAAYCVRNP